MLRAKNEPRHGWAACWPLPSTLVSKNTLIFTYFLRTDPYLSLRWTFLLSGHPTWCPRPGGMGLRAPGLVAGGLVYGWGQGWEVLGLGLGGIWGPFPPKAPQGYGTLVRERFSGLLGEC